MSLRYHAWLMPCWGLNAEPWPCQASTLPTESHPQFRPGILTGFLMPLQMRDQLWEHGALQGGWQAYMEGWFCSKGRAGQELHTSLPAVTGNLTGWNQAL